MNITQQRTKLVLERMIKMVEADKDDAGMFSDELDVMLNQLLSCDAFGTEGQCDPRGDQRNTQHNDGYAMDFVEGLDDEDE